MLGTWITSAPADPLLDPKVCEDTLTRPAEAAPAARPTLTLVPNLPPAPPTSFAFTSLAQARNKFNNLRRHIVRNVGRGTVVTIDQTLSWAEHTRAEHSSTELKTLAEIYDRIRADFLADFERNVGEVERRLGQLSDEAQRERRTADVRNLFRTREGLVACRQQLTFESCANYWDVVREMTGLIRPVRAEAPQPIDPPHLQIFGTNGGSAKFRYSLRELSRDPRANERYRERMHIDPVGNTLLDQYAYVRNLDLAFSFFQSTPSIKLLDSKVGLSGFAMINGRSTKILVIFDPLQRYFTVMPEIHGEASRGYLRFVLTPDGRMVFRDSPAVPVNQVHGYLRDTHFAY